MYKKIAIIAGILSILVILWGAFWTFDGRYAKAEDQKALEVHQKAIERRLDYKIEKDHLIGMRDQLFQLRREYPPTAASVPAVVDKEMKELEATIPMQADKVKSLQEDGKK